MNLGDLEFKAEDFDCADIGIQCGASEEYAQLANRLLRERLAKAPVAIFEQPHKPLPTWCKVRLVCIEVIK